MYRHPRLRLVACVALLMGLLPTMAGAGVLVLCIAPGNHVAVELAHGDEHHGDAASSAGCQGAATGAPHASHMIRGEEACTDLSLFNDAPILPTRYDDLLALGIASASLGVWLPSWCVDGVARPTLRPGEADDAARPGLAAQVVRRVVLLI